MHILGQMNIYVSIFSHSFQCLSSRLQMLVKYVPTPPALGVGTEAAICLTHKHIGREPPGPSPSIVPAHLYV